MCVIEFYLARKRFGTTCENIHDTVSSKIGRSYFSWSQEQKEIISHIRRFSLYNAKFFV